MASEVPTFPGGESGHWTLDRVGLPVYRWTAALPARDYGTAGDLPDASGFPRRNMPAPPRLFPADPLFLLGNARLTLFVGASGRCTAMANERQLCRLNQGDAPNSGRHEAWVTIGGKRHTLVGLDSRAACRAETGRWCGVGWARFVTEAGGLRVTRTLGTPPGADVRTGVPAWTVAVEIVNPGGRAVRLTYGESLVARLMPCQEQLAHGHQRSGVTYPVRCATDRRAGRATVVFTATTDDPLGPGAPMAPASVDPAPPHVWVARLDAGRGVRMTPFAVRRDALSAEVGVRAAVTLAAGARIWLRFAFGYADDARDRAAALRTLRRGLGRPGGEPYRAAWRARVPAFAPEPDAALRVELQWHAHALLAMATRQDRLGGIAVIPQGMLYEYGLGMWANVRDHVQHALGAVGWAPELAADHVREACCMTDVDGHIKSMWAGAGRSWHRGHDPSDQEIYALWLLAEHLAADGDPRLLAARVAAPYLRAPARCVLDHVEGWFRYLRDDIARGRLGMPRLLSGDWNDCFFMYTAGTPFYFLTNGGESPVNAAMGAYVLAAAARELERAARRLPRLQRRLRTLAASMRAYRAKLVPPLLTELRGRRSLRRLFIDGKPALGERLFLEPQPWAMLMPEVPAAKRRAIWTEVRRRLFVHRKGAALMDPPWNGPFLTGGSGEGGGVWPAQNGPLVLALRRLDPRAAEEAFRRMTLMRHARDFPKLWPGAWSSSDSADTDALPTAGLPRGYSAPFPFWCAHVHAWPLTCWRWLRTREA